MLQNALKRNLINSLPALMVMLLFIALLGGGQNVQAQVTPPCCTDFDDSTYHGWDACPNGPYVTFDLRTPGPSGNPADIYLWAKDDPDASSICAGPDCLGDWTRVGEAGCGAFCFDVRIIYDGCVPGNPDCDTNGGWIPIPYNFNIYSGALCAAFRVTNPPYITGDDGDNPGWHHVCAPIALESGGVLPSNSYGHWEMFVGNITDFNTILANVDKIEFRIDFTTNPAEEIGLDNICLRDDVCPQSQIPTLTEWGMIIFGILLIGFMTWVLVKRRKTATINI